MIQGYISPVNKGVRKKIVMKAVTTYTDYYHRFSDSLHFPSGHLQV